MKAKKCRQCKAEFKPQYSTAQVVCSSRCAIQHQKMLSEKKEARQKAEKKKELMTKSDWVKLAQQVFNKYIRLRDQDKTCISCETPLKGKYDAGHFYSTGGYPGIRFNELNVHGQCVHCNQHKHGNIAEYSIRLPDRIGVQNYLELQSIRGIPARHTAEELKELITIYKQKIKEFNGKS